MNPKLIGLIVTCGLLATATTEARASTPHKVGRSIFSFTQPNRLEQFGDAQGFRKIGGYIWYPASPVKGSLVAPFINNVQGSQLAELLGVPLTLLQALPSRSFADAPVSRTARRYPVIVMSHGDTGSPLESTTTAEALAEAGFVVVGISLTHNSAAGFVGDQLVLGDPLASVQSVPPVIDEFSTFADRLANWEATNRLNRYFAQDISATIDELARVNQRPGPFRGKLDLSRIGAFGHSFGGSQSYRALVNDSRIDAAANVDGSTFDDLYQLGTTKPFLSFQSFRPNDSQIEEIRNQLSQLGYTKSQIDWIIERSTTDDAAFKNSRGAIQVRLPRAGHNDFTDRGLWQAFGIPSEALSTDLKPEYVLNVYQTYLKAFFKENLTGVHQPILRWKSKDPDVQLRWSRRLRIPRTEG